LAPQPRLGQDGPVREGERASLETRGDGISHIRDEDGDGGNGEERPNDEERFTGIAGWTKVTIADGEERDVAEVKRLKVAETL